MNPTKGKGERYIYCPHDGGACLDIVVKYGWSAFNCERCPIYMQSESYGKMDSPVKPGNDAVDDIDFVGARRTVPVDEHVESGEKKMATKTCSNCGLTKDIEEFTKNLTCKDGYEGQCKECRYEKAKKRALKKKGDDPDRLEKIKESAKRVKKVRNQKTEVSNQNEKIIPVVAETVSDGFISSVLPIDVEKMEEQNRADVRVFARAFVAGLKNEFIAAMTEQISGQAQGPAPTGTEG